MKEKMKIVPFVMIMTCGIFARGNCQETVFHLLKRDQKVAAQYFEQRNYQGALALYKDEAKKNPKTKDIYLRIGKCHYFLRQYRDAIAAYDEHTKMVEALPADDLYYYAESQSGVANYEKAIDYYKQYLSRVPDDQLVIKKIWRLKNKQFLFEDSLNYAVRPIILNTGYSELCAVPYRNGLIYISNRKEVQLVEKIDASSNAPFYRMYYASLIADTVIIGAFQYGKSAIFSKSIGSKFHDGPLCFYDDDRKMVFTSTSHEVSANGKRTLQLFFGEETSEDWKISMPFPYNSLSYSISDPAISHDGKVLYFSSDMNGGVGGKDLYRSEFINGQWSKPENLGEHINTRQDEVFPFLHDNKTLYFSSNGHAGLGGLDLFKTSITEEGFGEVHNLGYPLNSNEDEFGIFIDSPNTHGYFSSNRKNGGHDDDIYEVDIDLQTYPVTISGIIKYKEHNWTDTSALKVFANAKLFLIDNIRNITVFETAADENGNFSIVIPYFTKYRIRVVGEEHGENVVSLDIPKQRRLLGNHEIVVVKDAFRSQENQLTK
jgi:hypothetical protein